MFDLIYTIQQYKQNNNLNQMYIDILENLSFEYFNFKLKQEIDLYNDNLKLMRNEDITINNYKDYISNQNITINVFNLILERFERYNISQFTNYEYIRAIHINDFINTLLNIYHKNNILILSHRTGLGWIISNLEYYKVYNNQSFLNLYYDTDKKIINQNIKSINKNLCRLYLEYLFIYDSSYLLTDKKIINNPVHYYIVAELKIKLHNNILNNLQNFYNTLNVLLSEITDNANKLSQHITNFNFNYLYQYDLHIINKENLQHEINLIITYKVNLKLIAHLVKCYILQILLEKL